VRRRHCDEAGRDPTQIEVTTLINVADDADPDTILAEAEALGAVGVQTIMARSTTAEPARWLEEVWGPVIPRLATIGT
jgi:hypothetical protein